MDSVVRAVGRIVVWVDAAAEESTIRISRWDRTLPSVPPPNTEVPRTDSTSPALFGLARPMPLAPMPENDCAAKITSA